MSVPALLSRFAAVAIASALLSGCGMTIVPKASPEDVAGAPAGERVVFGRINYVIDGKQRTPYGASYPAWPAPFVHMVRLESGIMFATPAVGGADGRFRWRLSPGSYVITRIGAGQFTDQTFVAWPRVAFQVPPEGGPVYLGHLVLEGTTSVRPLPDGGSYEFIGYRFLVRDEFAEDAAALGPGVARRATRSLMLHDPQMPIGDELSEEWQRSRRSLVERIFGPATMRLPE